MPERRNRPASRVYVETELELEEPAEDGGRYILEDLERLNVFHNNTSDRFVDLERSLFQEYKRSIRRFGAVNCFKNTSDRFVDLERLTVSRTQAIDSSIWSG
jgi:hypothetical protein